MRRMQWLVGTAIVALAASAQAAEIIGRVLMAAGDVRAIRAGKEIPLQYTSPIEAGDRVRTGSASHTQIRLTDESIVSLRPETEFAFTDYRYGRKEDGAERALFRLLKGGLRTITGLVGRRNHQNYRLETPTATIGIRGTHYVLVLCQQNCYNADGSRAPDGLYGNTTGFSYGTNRISATNKTGEKVFGVNEPFHVADINAEPRRLIAPPTFLSDRLTGREHNKGRGAQNADRGVSDGRSVTALSPPEGLPTTAPEQRNAAGQPAAVTKPLPSVGNGGVAHFENVNSSFTNPLVGASLTADAQGELAAFSGGTIAGARGSGNAQDVGFNVAAGNLQWGMWPNATVNGLPATNLHYIVGDLPTLPGGGTFTYSPVGGTRPTNFQGVTGAFVGGTVTVDFTPGTLQLNNWQVAFNGATYSQSGAAGTTFGRSPGFSGTVNWNCAGNCGAVSGPVSGNYAGSFTGAGAPGMGVVYRVFDIGNNGQIVGAEGFTR